MRWFLFVLLVCCVKATAAPQSIRFVLYYPQVPPYMYTNQDSAAVQGVVPQILQEFFAAQQIAIEYVIDNRKGAEYRLYRGDVDAMLLTRTWAQYPEKLLFSAALLEHRDFLFSTTPFKTNSTIDDWLHNGSICTRQYYVYEALQPYFERSTKRVDASSELAQMRMLQSGRCQYAYMNEHVARWLQQSQFPQQTFYRSPQSFGNVGLTIAFHPRWQWLMPALDKFLRDATTQSKVQRLLHEETQKKGRLLPASASQD